MLGIIARMDLGSGLQSQSLNLCKMLKPDKVLLIDSSPFNEAKQVPELYEGFNTDKAWGFPQMDVYRTWLQGLTHILTAETFYNDNVINYCLRNNIKTYVQPNYEFMDAMVQPRTAPTMYLMPSYWKLEEVRAQYPETVYLPPPLFPNDFKKARDANFKRSGKRFLHIVGKYASKDRNGTKSLIEALKYTTEDFELVIRTQSELDFWTDDPRVKLEIKNVEETQELYTDFDAMILPRRYGGLCLPMNEALMSGLPVIMTDISPNNQVLPKEWLVKADVHDKLLTRMVLDVYNADAHQLAMKIDQFCTLDLSAAKATAFDIGMNYAAENLRDKYKEALI